MAKVNSKDEKSLQDAQNKNRGSVSYRKMEDGRIVAAKWSAKRKISSKK